MEQAEAEETRMALAKEAAGEPAPKQRKTMEEILCRARRLTIRLASMANRCFWVSAAELTVHILTDGDRPRIANAASASSPHHTSDSERTFVVKTRWRLLARWVLHRWRRLVARRRHARFIRAILTIVRAWHREQHVF